MMKCGVKSKSYIVEDKEYQDLSGWEGKGVTLEELRTKLHGHYHDDVYVYTVKSTNFDKESKTVRHTGSGPNLEGELATLCTCKYLMRQRQAEWKGKWILGLTSRDRSKGFESKHYPFYLMKVDRSFDSQKEIFEYLKQTNPEALGIKDAVKNRLGDVFEPVSNCTNPLDPKMYKTPHKNHSHIEDRNGAPGWHDDIVYEGKSSPFLVGDKDNTFVWPQPMIRYIKDRGIGYVKLRLGDVLGEDLKDNKI